MKITSSLFLILLFISTYSYAYEPKIEIFEQFDNFRVVAFLNKNDIEKSPTWKPGMTAPPLTVVGAIQALQTFVKKSNAANTIAENTIKEIEIRTIPKDEQHWHYLIKVADEAMQAKYDIYVILMDGTVIPTIIEPQGYK